jgi:hypothetical protein
VVQKALGHDKAEVTLNTYLHVWPDDDEGSWAAVEDVLGPIIAGSPVSPSQVRKSVKSPSPHAKKLSQIKRQYGSDGQVAMGADP